MTDLLVGLACIIVLTVFTSVFMLAMLRAFDLDTKGAEEDLQMDLEESGRCRW